ncbi:MAG: dihydrodipicolinate synthase family protein, partial [Coprothermobacterota bacterium]|nr:dihydrodipicolinate synthase family protein [Coprothermobacterota bacterium]
MILHGILPALVTPFLAGGDIDWEALAFNLHAYNQISLAGYVVLGTSGEFPFLNDGERAQLIECVRSQAAPGKIVVAGVGAESTAETIRRGREAASLGVDAALVLPPHYFKGSMSEVALERHFRTVADALTIPLLIYNMPANTGLNLSAALVKRLADHPRIIGLKDSGGNLTQLEEVIEGVPDCFSVFTGAGSLLFPALAMGANGAILAVANVFPALCLAIYQAAVDGEQKIARWLQSNLLETNAAVTSRWGIAGMKRAMDL